MKNNTTVKERDFNFYIPLDVYKDKGKNWRIKGLASTGEQDLQGEILKQNGLDISVLRSGKGYLNWEHKSDPKNIIGLIDDAEITNKGLVIDGHLFHKHDQAKAVHQIMDSLSDDKKHRIQMSVEGKVISKSDGKNSKVIDKARITAVALTMNPVNQSTYTELVKSLIHEDGALTGDEFPSSFSSSTPPLNLENNDKLEEVLNSNSDNRDSESDNKDKELVERTPQEEADQVTETVSKRVDERQFEKAIDYFIDKVDEKGLDFEGALKQLNVILKADFEGQERFKRFIKSLEGNPFAEDIIKNIGHKYFKREKRGGKWVYYYKDGKGKLVEGKKPKKEKDNSSNPNHKDGPTSWTDSKNVTHLNFAVAEEKAKKMTEAELKFQIKDAKEASQANPEGHKSGYYQDEVHVAVKELNNRKGKRWAYGTKINEWVLVDKKDRDFDTAIEPKEMDKIGRAKAKEKYLNANIVGSKKEADDLGDKKKSHTIVDFMKANVDEAQWEEFIDIARKHG